jgi:hypothetical protein
MAYLTEGDLENYILQDIDSSYSTWITSVISQVTAYINNYCGINFENSASSNRYFDGDGFADLKIDDYQLTSEIKILDTDGSTIATLVKDTDYYEYPYNDTIKNIIRLSASGQQEVFPDRPRSVKVTGIFGYASAPDDIKLAAIKLAAKVINEGLRGGAVDSESLGSYKIDYKDLDEYKDSLGIKEILNQYRSLSL